MTSTARERIAYTLEEGGFIEPCLKKQTRTTERSIQ